MWEMFTEWMPLINQVKSFIFGKKSESFDLIYDCSPASLPLWETSVRGKLRLMTYSSRNCFIMYHQHRASCFQREFLGNEPLGKLFQSSLRIQSTVRCLHSTFLSSKRLFRHIIAPVVMEKEIRDKQRKLFRFNSDRMNSARRENLFEKK